MVEVRDPAAEAVDVLGDGRAGRVLEPSPPAVDDGDWFADDPVYAAVEADVVVAPVGGDQTWADVVADRTDLAPWAADRWLGAYRQLTPWPGGEEIKAKRTALHRLATYVVAPARHQANGKFGLRWTRGGFGTPFFGDDAQVRVEGDLLVVQEGDSVRSTPITTLAAAADFIGSKIDGETAAEHDSPPLGDVDADLGIDASAVAILSDWWGMATAALEIVRADDESIDASRVQIWPGHFDPAIEAGEENRRASYGASPGDQHHADPYLYVAAWWPDRLDLPADDLFWNSTEITAAALFYDDVAKADDPVAMAVEHFRAGRDRLAAASLVES